MRYLLSGGGTGGHIYPAIAIADRIREGDPKAEIQFVGAVGGLEMDLVPAHGYPIKSITVSYIKRSMSFHNVKTAAKLVKGLIEAGKILKEYSPDWVIGTGGYVSGPLVFVAAKKGYRTLIHEQNAYPGLTNRILSKYANKIAVSFPDAIEFMDNKDSITVTGNPIRREYYQLTEKEAKKSFPEYDGTKMVLITGGSGGSAKINEAVEAMIKQYPTLSFSLYWATGRKFYKNIENRILDEGFLLAGHHIVPYIDNMPHALKACNLVVCSAGAITIAEVQAADKYAVLIPKAYTAENHQEKNAIMMEAGGYGAVIKETELSPDLLFERISEGLVYSNHTIEHTKIRPAVDKIWEMLRER